jgi:hypothetical protein
MVFTLSCATPERAERPVFTASTLNETAPAQEATIPPAQGEPETATTTGHDGPLSITVQDALLMALENNRALKIERFNPAITQTAEEEARAEFDPLFTGEYAYDRRRGMPARVRLREGWKIRKTPPWEYPVICRPERMWRLKRPRTRHGRIFTATICMRRGWG